MQTLSKMMLTLFAIGWLAGCSHDQQNSEADKKAIKDIVKSNEEAYNQQDAKKLTEHWASNATFDNPVKGVSAEGREAIEKLFKQIFAEGKKRHVEITVKSIEFPSANEAIENGVMTVAIEGEPAQKVAYQSEYIKENGKWLVSSFGEIALLEPTSNFEQLKDLEWLVGKWVDSDANVDITFENQWDKYKNFLTQHFNLKVFGQDDIEGKQIIAWDPVKGAVRSWVFDSDGGFGEATWEKVDKSWYATLHFTLSDGRIASSIQIYTPVDANSYTFASVEREVDGEILPDMNPVTVEKIQ